MIKTKSKRQIERQESGIYVIKCVSNNSFYIGRTVNFSKRINDHLRDLRKGNHKNPRLQRVFNKYGEDSLRYWVLVPLWGSEELHIKVEQYLINLFINDENCLNINKTAGGGCIVDYSHESRLKMSASKQGSKNPMYGKKQKQESKDKIRRALKGRPHTEERRRKISEARKGLKLTNEHKEKLKDRFSGEGNPMFGRKGADNPKSKAVSQIDRNTHEVIREFASAREVKRILGYDSSCISKVCRGKLPHAYGFLWRYK